MRKTLLATFGAAMLALSGGMGDLGSAQAHGPSVSRTVKHVTVSVAPRSHITYVSHSRNRHFIAPQYRGYHGYPSGYYRAHPPYGKAYGYWKKHPQAHWQAKQRQHHRDDRHDRNDRNDRNDRRNHR